MGGWVCDEMRTSVAPYELLKDGGATNSIIIMIIIVVVAVAVIGFDQT